MKNITVFLSENFQLLEVKISVYLNKRVFVMHIIHIYMRWYRAYCFEVTSQHVFTEL